jgi:uncharacterized protein (TIGR02757 family)
MAKAPSLKIALDRICQKYDRSFISPDPVEIPHEYADPADQELAALVAAVLAYGNVRQILASVRSLMNQLGPRPARRVSRLTNLQAIEATQGLKHRFNTETDFARLLLALRDIMNEHGSLEAAFMRHWRSDHANIGPALEGFALDFRERDYPEIESRRLERGLRSRYDFFFPLPSAGGACKRLNLFLRWMARPADGVDFGLWKNLPPAKLVMPVDTHVFRIARQIGLVERKTADWKAAVEITERLRKFEPEDPLRYDFALTRPGILGECGRCEKGDPSHSCALEKICRR